MPYCSRFICSLALFTVFIVRLATPLTTFYPQAETNAQCGVISQLFLRCRESRSYGDFNACFDPRARLIMCAANSVLTFHVSNSRPLNKSASSLRLCLFHCLLFSVLPRGFERRRTCSYWYMCAPFFIFFLTQVFTPFDICASLFFYFLCFLPFFFFSSQFSHL